MPRYLGLVHGLPITNASSRAGGFLSSHDTAAPEPQWGKELENGSGKRRAARKRCIIGRVRHVVAVSGSAAPSTRAARYCRVLHDKPKALSFG
jgi:hypothetical protein